MGIHTIRILTMAYLKHVGTSSPSVYEQMQGVEFTNLKYGRGRISGMNNDHPMDFFEDNTPGNHCI